MQLAFYFDQTRCIGCYTCVVACKDWHDIPAGPASWRRVICIEQGKYPHPFLAYLSTSCHHCEEPECVAVCPANAITKRESDGIVMVDREACLGRDDCGMCLEACPYEVPQFGDEENPRMQKCGFCTDRWAEDKLPICVAGCPTRALDAGPLEDMQAKYGTGRAAAGFDFNDKLGPSIIFKGKESHG